MLQVRLRWIDLHVFLPSGLRDQPEAQDLSFWGGTEEPSICSLCMEKCMEKCASVSSQGHVISRAGVVGLIY